MDSAIDLPNLSEEEVEDDEKDHLLVSDVQILDDDGKIVELETDPANEYIIPSQMPPKKRRRRSVKVGETRRTSMLALKKDQNEPDFVHFMAINNNGLDVKTESVEKSEGNSIPKPRKRIDKMPDLIDKDGKIIFEESTKRKQPEKSHACTVCEYKAHSAANLLKHFRRHTGEKPFSCSLCEYRCSDKSSLFRHDRSHVKVGDARFACELCDFKCTETSTLIYHNQKVHSSAKPYSCDMCDYRCTCIRYLTKHKKSRHDVS